MWSGQGCCLHAQGPLNAQATPRMLTGHDVEVTRTKLFTDGAGVCVLGSDGRWCGTEAVLA